jgi:ribosomal protein S18 acetylase RimI-like enzyme
MKPRFGIRAARTGETDAVTALCRRFDGNDYAQAAWRGWVETHPDFTLIAEVHGRIVGCVRAGVEAAGCAFAQALRVDPEFRRIGVATALMQELCSRLAKAGVSRVLGVTGADNVPARRLHPAIGMSEVIEIARRRHPAWGRLSAAAAPLDESAAAALAGREGLLVSRPGAAHFRRIYFRAAADWLRARSRDGQLVELPGGGWALLDQPGAEGAWVAAFQSEASRVADLIDAAVPAGRPRPVTVEAPADPSWQSQLSAIGFEAPGPADRYVILEATLARSITTPTAR